MNLEGDALYMKDVTIPLIYNVAFKIVAMVIVAIGIMGNILNLIVLTRPKLKGVMYVYLVGLAISNLSVLITAIPALMAIAKSPEPMYSNSYVLSFFFAHLEIPLLNAFMAASVYIIIGMTVNRYISIYKPTHFQRIHTFKNAYLAIAASFLFGSLLHVPLAFQNNVYELCTDDTDKMPKDYCNRTETEDPGGGGRLTVEHPNKYICNEKTYVVCGNEDYTKHWVFSVYIYFSESLLRFGPIITLTILNILIIARFNRIVRRREVLKGNNPAASISGRNGSKRKITASSTSGTTSSGNNNTSSCRNNSNVYVGLSPNGDCPELMESKKCQNGGNTKREDSLIPSSPILKNHHSNGKIKNGTPIEIKNPINEEDTKDTCCGCIPKGIAQRKDSDAISDKQTNHRSPSKTNGTSHEGLNGLDAERRKSSNRYLMTPDQSSVLGSNGKRESNAMSSDNVSSGFCSSDTRANSTALTTVSEVTAMTFASNCNGGGDVSQSATPLMTPRTPLQNRRGSSRMNSKTHSLNGNANLLTPGGNEGSATNLRGMPHRVSSRRRGLHSPEERMLVVVLIAIVVLFVICTTPAAILSILFMKDTSLFQVSLGYAIFRAMANNFELLGFALNFFVYCLCSADIRRAFVDVLFENCLVAFIKTHIFSRCMRPFRSSSPNGSNGSYEVEVRPYNDQVNPRPSLAIMREVSEQPPREDVDGNVENENEDIDPSLENGIETNGSKPSDPSSILIPATKSNQDISAVPTNGIAINSIVTIITEPNCNGENDEKPNSEAIPAQDV